MNRENRVRVSGVKYQLAVTKEGKGEETDTKYFKGCLSTESWLENRVLNQYPFLIPLAWAKMHMAFEFVRFDEQITISASG